MPTNPVITLYLLNLQFGAWGSHFITVFVLEEIEAILLLIFYRKAYFQKTGIDWKLIYGFNSRTKMRKMSFKHSKGFPHNMKKPPPMKFAYYDYRKFHPKVQ